MSSVQCLRVERALGDGSRRSSGRRWSFLARRGNEWTAVAAVELVGGDGYARQGKGRERERGRGHGETGENERGTWWSVWHS